MTDPNTEVISEHNKKRPFSNVSFSNFVLSTEGRLNFQLFVAVLYEENMINTTAQLC